MMLSWMKELKTFALSRTPLKKEMKRKKSISLKENKIKFVKIFDAADGTYQCHFAFHKMRE